NKAAVGDADARLVAGDRAAGDGQRAGGAADAVGDALRNAGVVDTARQRSDRLIVPLHVDGAGSEAASGEADDHVRRRRQGIGYAQDDVPLAGRGRAGVGVEGGIAGPGVGVAEGDDSAAAAVADLERQVRLSGNHAVDGNGVAVLAPDESFERAVAGV